jgi:DMSO reductase anchor subunit
MSEYELPLVFFTVFCQWAVGTIVAITVLILAQPSWLSDEKRFNVLRQLALGIVAINILGSVLSLLHLGSPTGAYRAILGIGHSWLSREVIAFALLNAVVVIWAAMMFRFNSNPRLIRQVSLLASGAGVAAILVSAQVYYQMASHPLGIRRSPTSVLSPPPCCWGLPPLGCGSACSMRLKMIAKGGSPSRYRQAFYAAWYCC